MKTLVLCNQKGGVGKSAVATLLAQHLACQGSRVLAIDLDHQGNLSKPLLASGRATAAAFTAEALFTGQPHTQPSEPFVLVPSSRDLLSLERQPERHTPFARQLRAFLARMDDAFDVCIVDTNPNPDIRVIAALASADFALSPIQLNQEAMDGVSALLNHDRVGLRRIKAVLNGKLQLIGLLPTMVEATPFQKANFLQVVQRYYPLMIRIGADPGALASSPRSSRTYEFRSGPRCRSPNQIWSRARSDKAVGCPCDIVEICCAHSRGATSWSSSHPCGKCANLADTSSSCATPTRNLWRCELFRGAASNLTFYGRCVAQPVEHQGKRAKGTHGTT